MERGLSKSLDIVSRNGCAKVCSRCWERGLIPTFLEENAFRIQPPPSIDPNRLEARLDILADTMRDDRAGRIGDEGFDFAKGWE